MTPLLPPACSRLPLIPENEILAIEVETLMVRPSVVWPSRTRSFDAPAAHPVWANLAREASSWMGI